MAHVIALQLDQRSASYARIILPLSGDGRTLDMLMVVDSEKQNTLSEFVEPIQKIGRRR